MAGHLHAQRFRSSSNHKRFGPMSHLVAPLEEDQTRKHAKFVLITPARNGEQFIEQTIRSVISQSRLPVKWVIVSDGSTDRTDAIVTSYLDQYPWIELVRRPERQERQFAAKQFV